MKRITGGATLYPHVMVSLEKKKRSLHIFNMGHTFVQNFFIELDVAVEKRTELRIGIKNLRSVFVPLDAAKCHTGD